MGTLAILSTESELPEAVRQFALFEDLVVNIQQIGSIEELASVADLEGIILQGEGEAWASLDFVRRIRASVQFSTLPVLVFLPDLNNYLRAVCFDFEFILPCSLPPVSMDLVPALKKVTWFSRKKRAMLDKRLEIEQRLRKKEFDGIETLLEEFGAHEKDGFRVNLIKARIALEKKDFKGAAEVITTAIKENKHSLEARCILASVYVEGGAIDKAQDVLNKSLVMAPDHPPFLTIQGRIALLNGQWPEAIESFSKSLQIDASQTLAAAGQLVGHLMTKQAVEAKNLLKDIGPSAAKYLHSFALDLGKVNRHTEAELLLQMGLKLLPSQKDIYKVWMNLGLQAKRNGQLKKALAFFKACAASAPADYDKVQPQIRDTENSIKKSGAA